MKVIGSNSKTIRSLDLSTECPKRRAGNPCSYCYVETARKQGFRAKKVYDRIPYNNEILRLRQSTIDKLNAIGGLRIFSFGDYIEWMDEDLMQVFKDAKERGLKLKAITKVPEFVEKFHDYVDIINVSVDNLGEGMDWDTAKELKRKYPNVKIRCAIMKDEDLDALEWVDIITFNHANNGYKFYSKEEVQKFGEQYPNKVCCLTGKCETCEIKCGATV